jgi:hypothetical protein
MPKGKPTAAKQCKVCTSEFLPTNNAHIYCGKTCKRSVAKSVGGAETTERQYALITGNWEKYYGRLCLPSFQRTLLSKHDCRGLLKAQNYKCALTGVELTCILEKGTVCKTNASIDRIDPKGAYTKNNVQLVCAVINKLRIDMSVDEFINWCTKVSDYAIRK